MIPLQTFVPAALARIIRKAPLTDEKVAFAWRTAVGPAVAAASDVVLNEHTLQVRARDRVWQRELERSAAMIRMRLDDLLGAGVVTYIDITVAGAPAPEKRSAATQSGTVPAAAASVPKRRPSGDGSGTARRRR